MKNLKRMIPWTVLSVVAALFVSWGFVYRPYERVQELMPGTNSISNALYILNGLPVIVFIVTLLAAWICIRIAETIQWELSPRTKSVIVIVALALGGYICGMLTDFPLSAGPAMDEHVIYDGACSASNAGKISTAQKQNAIVFHCNDYAGTHVFYMNISELTGSDYIVRHPGAKIHCAISLTQARCDTSTVRPSDP